MHLFQLVVLLALVQVSAQDGLDDTNTSKDTNTQADSLPVETSALIQAPGLVAEERGQTDDADKVGNDDAGRLAVGEGGKLAGEPRVGLAGLGLSSLLGLFGLGLGFSGGLTGFLAGLAGLVLAVEAGSLRLGLDVLLEEVGGDGVDRGHVDVDEGSGGGGLDVDDFVDLRGSSLDIIREGSEDFCDEYMG